MTGLRDRLAELMAQHDFTPAAKQHEREVAPREASPRADPRPKVVVVDPTGDPACEHKWQIVKGVRSCWLCGAPGGRVGARPPVVMPKRDGGLAVSARMAATIRLASEQGHHLGRWTRRPNDQYGRHNAFCETCMRMAVVGESAAPGLPLVYGEALHERCVPKKAG